MTLKNLSKVFFEKFGLKIHQIDTPMRSLERGLEVLASHVQPKTVIDIGVASGTLELYRAFPSSSHRYVLIEADPFYSQTVIQLGQKLDARVEMVFCGASTGTVTLHAASNHEFSTAHRLKAGMRSADIQISVKTLDSLIESEECPFLIKIDVEGGEMDVLEGARRTLGNAAAVVIETSVAPKYDSGPEFADVMRFMHEQGFSVFDLLAGANKNGKLYQVDAVFVRTDAPFR